MTTKRVNLTDLRPELTALLGRVQHSNEKVIITKHGKAVAALVSMTAYERVWDAEEEYLHGPRNPLTGRRPGASLLRMSDVLKGRGWCWWREEKTVKW